MIYVCEMSTYISGRCCPSITVRHPLSSDALEAPQTTCNNIIYQIRCSAAQHKHARRMPRLRPILECADKAKIATSPSSEVITVNLVFCHNGPIAEGLSSNIAVRGVVRSIL
jgi:hypothetical protein